MMKLESVFCDNMVLQRNMPVYVFGTGDGHAKISLGGFSATADSKDGKMGARSCRRCRRACPYTLTAELNNEVFTVHGVMSGEVFILSGQSNMDDAAVSVTAGGLTPPKR